MNKDDLIKRIDELTIQLKASLEYYNNLTQQVEAVKNNHNAMAGRLEEAKHMLEYWNKTANEPEGLCQSD